MTQIDIFYLVLAVAGLAVAIVAAPDCADVAALKVGNLILGGCR